MKSSEEIQAEIGKLYAIRRVFHGQDTEACLMRDRVDAQISAIEYDLTPHEILVNIHPSHDEFDHAYAAACWLHNRDGYAAPNTAWNTEAWIYHRATLTNRCERAEEAIIRFLRSLGRIFSLRTNIPV